MGDPEPKNILPYICTYRFSQDHLESFFGSMRTKGGCNNNPNAVHFRACYKRLIHHNDVTSTAKANCTEFNDTKILLGEGNASYIQDKITRSNTAENDHVYEELKERLMTADLSASNSIPEDFLNEAVTRDATEVQKALLEKLKCEKCINAVLNEDRNSDTNVCPSVMMICKISNTEFSILVNKKSNFNVEKYFTLLTNCILTRIQNEYENVLDCLQRHIIEDNEVKENHSVKLMKLIVDSYLNIRITRYCETVITFKQSTRNKLNKLILFQGH